MTDEEFAAWQASEAQRERRRERLERAKAAADIRREAAEIARLESGANPQSPPAVDIVTHDELKSAIRAAVQASARGLAKIMKDLPAVLRGEVKDEGFCGLIAAAIRQELEPIVRRVEALESHSESASDQADDLKRRIASLDTRLTAQSANARRGIQ